ncbi:MAG TPA: hypothetical protein DEH27_02165 [Deltaproteobacteria bacterium]|nr:hypothetical protein [Deltaproteobacteria bacterium]
MHDYLEKVVAILREMFGKALSLSDIDLAFFLGVIMASFLWFIASYIESLLDERKRNKFFQIERELFGIQETDETGEQGGKPEIDASRQQLFWDDPPEKGTTKEKGHELE